MQGGDISNEPAPRLMLEFEGLLGIHPPRRLKYAIDRKFGRWRAAANAWRLNDQVVKVIRDRAWRMHLDIDVITFQPPEFADALADRLETENIPVRRVYSYTLREITRDLINMPHVQAIYSADPSRARLAYGHRGRLVTTQTIAEIGRY